MRTQHTSEYARTHAKRQAKTGAKQVRESHEWVETLGGDDKAYQVCLPLQPEPACRVFADGQSCRTHAMFSRVAMISLIIAKRLAARPLAPSCLAHAISCFVALRGGRERLGAPMAPSVVRSSVCWLKLRAGSACTDWVVSAGQGKGMM